MKTHTHTDAGWGTNMIEAIDCLKADFQTYWKHYVRCQITFIWCQVEEKTSMLARSSTPSSTMSDFVGLLPLRHYDKVIKLIVTFHINNHWDVLTGVVVESTCSNEHGPASTCRCKRNLNPIQGLRRALVLKDYSTN